jgi:hypothetical protein
MKVDQRAAFQRRAFLEHIDRRAHQLALYPIPDGGRAVFYCWVPLPRLVGALPRKWRTPRNKFDDPLLRNDSWRWDDGVVDTRREYYEQLKHLGCFGRKKRKSLDDLWRSFQSDLALLKKIEEGRERLRQDGEKNCLKKAINNVADDRKIASSTLQYHYKRIMRRRRDYREYLSLMNEAQRRLPPNWDLIDLTRQTTLRLILR